MPVFASCSLCGDAWALTRTGCVVRCGIIRIHELLGCRLLSCKMHSLGHPYIAIASLTSFTRILVGILLLPCAFPSALQSPIRSIHLSTADGEPRTRGARTRAPHGRGASRLLPRRTATFSRGSWRRASDSSCPRGTFLSKLRFFWHGGLGARFMCSCLFLLAVTEPQEHYSGCG